MGDKVRPARRVVKCQRLEVMLAGFLRGRAASVKLGHRLVDWETSDWEIFKCARRHGRDFFPARDRWPPVAERPVSRIVIALKFEYLQR